jgi:uncharacterized protein (TIGR02246 family)
MSIEELLHAYCAAFSARDARGVAALFAGNGLYELPLLGQRLVGRDEIRAGLAQAFALVDTCAIEIVEIKVSARMAIGEGGLRAKLHRDHEAVDMPVAMVAEGSDGALSRFATHLDARPYRLWCDGPIFAVAG